jgi:glycine/D-amino acid oxidase-like deaminating enzyme/thioredoxin reductase
MFIKDKNVEISAKKIKFKFQKKSYFAYEGDTVSSALIRNGIKNFREDKHKNYRGIFCNMGICNECIVEINGNQSIKACTKEIYNDDNILIQKYNADLPFIKEDIQLVKKIINLDILIIGAGPGGIGASLSLKSSKQKVALLDEKNSIGGQYYKKISKVFSVISPNRLDGQMKEGIGHEKKIINTNINLFLGYKVWGAYKNHNSEYEICCSKDNIDLRILCKKLIVASGSFEKPFFVSGWHLPNVLTTGGTQILVNSQKIIPGKKIIICGNGPLNFQLADELKKGGASVVAVVESSKNPFLNPFFSMFCLFLSPVIFLKGIKNYLNIFFSDTKIIHEAFIAEIKEVDGKKSIFIEKKNKKNLELNSIDIVSLNYGFYPNNDIGKLLGLDGQFNKKKNYFEIKKNIFNQTSDENIFFVGEAASNVGAKISLYEGQLTGLFLNSNFKKLTGLIKMPILFFNLMRSKLFQKALWKIFNRTHSNIASIKKETIFCRCEDVRYSEILKHKDLPNVDAGLIKRMTRTGMGRCQGRYCGIGLLEIFNKKISNENYKQYSFAPQNPIKTVPLKNVGYEKEEWYGYVKDKLPEFQSINKKIKEKHKHKIAVIGAGIMGVSTCYSLMKEEKDVCLIDRRQPNSQASGSNAGSLHVQLLSYDFDPKNLLQVENLKNSLKLQKKGITKWKSIEKEINSNFEISNDGGLMLAENEKDLEKLNMKIELEKSAGIEIKLIDKNEIYNLNNSISDKMINAGYCAEEGKINPLKATTEIFNYCVNKGLSAYCDDLILDIKKNNGKFLITTNDREITADIIVNCAGSWANNISNFLDLPLNVKSVPQQMIVTEPATYELKLLIAHIGRHLTLKQAQNGNYIIGGGWTAGYSNLTKHIHSKKESFEGNAWIAKKVIPKLSNANILRTWAAMSVDVGGYPLLGEHPNMKNFYVVVSQNGYTLGPVLGDLVSDQILFDKKDLNLFDSSRLN